MTIAAILVAAGRGARAGMTADGPKQYFRLANRAVLWHSVRAFLQAASIDRVVVVIHADDQERARDALGELCDRVHLVLGGATRQQSVREGLRFLRSLRPELVLIHDGVRPFVSGSTIQSVIEATGSGSGAIPAMAVSDTLKRSDTSATIQETVDRRGLFAAQTPQAFPFEAILDAHERAANTSIDFTDDASIAEWAELPVRLVPGEADNIKLTLPRDLSLAHERLKGTAPMIDVRTGNGYDVHQLVPGDHVTLCGVRIEHDQSLLGHSDADVGLHALTDALLATCGAGDIGTHFPPSEPQWKGAASRIFVEHAVDLIRARNGRICNVDVTLICEAPKVGPHREAMTRALAEMTGLDRERVSIKATTNETIGFVGRREGIAAIATASVVFGD